jgi:hypothetical protein
MAQMMQLHTVHTHNQIAAMLQSQYFQPIKLKEMRVITK